MKYKVGDRVRVRHDLEAGEAYKQEGEACARCIATPGMTALAGKVVTIAPNVYSGRYRVEGNIYSWTDGMFEGLASASKIVVTTDGKTVTARLFAGKELVKTAEAKCSPQDAFVFETGAAIALDRLLDREAKEEAPAFSKDELINGRFGRLDNGKWFVVVGDRLTYQDGGWDPIGIVDASGKMYRSSIDCIVVACSYDHARSVMEQETFTSKVIWKRPGAKF